MSAADRAGWVLVGGLSRRMGTNKALLRHGEGATFARYVAEQAAKVCGMVSLVGDPVQYAGLGLPVVADNFPGIGPLGGMEAALGATSASLNLVVACDMPAVDGVNFESLFAAGGDCALPQYEDGRVEPLCAVYHRRCVAAIREAIEDGVRKVTDALRDLDIRYVRVRNGAPFANLNTPEELRRYRNG